MKKQKILAAAAAVILSASMLLTAGTSVKAEGEAARSNDGKVRFTATNKVNKIRERLRQRIM